MRTKELKDVTQSGVVLYRPKLIFEPQKRAHSPQVLPEGSRSACWQC